MVRWITLACLLTATSTACASGPAQRDADKLALYRAHAGAPVDGFRYYGSVNGWTALGSTALALWSRPGEAWLLELGDACPDLDFARAISVSDTSGRISARFDKVRVVGSGAIDAPCPIREIRPLDVRAIRKAERAARAAAQASGT